MLILINTHELNLVSLKCGTILLDGLYQHHYPTLVLEGIFKLIYFEEKESFNLMLSSSLCG